MVSQLYLRASTVPPSLVCAVVERLLLDVQDGWRPERGEGEGWVPGDPLYTNTPTVGVCTDSRCATTWTPAQASDRCPECGAPSQLAHTMPAPTDDRSPKLTADAVLFAEAHVLLIRRGWEPFKGSLALPGGFKEDGETFAQAARRELLEETGIVAPEPFFDVGVYDAPGRDPRGPVTSMGYWGVLGQRTPPTAGDDAVHAEWIPVQDVLSGAVAVAFDHRQIIADAAARHDTLVREGWTRVGSGGDPIELDPDLDSLSRAQLAELDGPAGAVAAVLFDWSHRVHGVTSTGHHVGLFLELLAAAGWRVTAIPPGPPIGQLLPPPSE